MKRLRNPLFLIALTIFMLANGTLTRVEAQKSKKSARLQAAQSLSPADTPAFVEDFSYAAGAVLTANGWAAHSSGGTNAIQVTSPGLTFTGYPSSGVGNAITVATNGEDDNRLFTSPVSSGTLYAAVLVNVSSAQATGDYFFHFFVNSSTFYGRVFAKAGATGYNLGISRTASNSGTPVYTTAEYAYGTTHLLVVKYTFNVGGTSDDTVSLFVDPKPGQAEPAATVTATDFLTTDAANIPGIGVRQGSSTAAPQVRLDGIRVGTTWASVTAPAIQAPNVDMDGDGRSDFVVLRDPALSGFASFTEGENRRSRKTRNTVLNNFAAGSGNSPSATQENTTQWWMRSSASNFQIAATWGNLADGDYHISADFDGDRVDDFVYWHPDTVDPEASGFYWVSTATGAFHYSRLGLPGDDPTVIGDWDGDGTDDPTTFRCPPTPGQCYFFYRPSTGPEIVWYHPWGFAANTDFLFPCPADYTGDGKTDACVQVLHPSITDQTMFVIQNSATFQDEYVTWGLRDDFVIPGDYDGDGRSDFCVTRRADDGSMVWYILERDGGTVFVTWGIYDTDFEAPGDYDGDGKQDIAVFRFDSPNPAFWTLLSSGGNRADAWGLPGDGPLARYFVR